MSPRATPELGQRFVVGSGQGTTRITGVDDAGRLDEQRVDVPLRDRAVLNTARYDEQLAGTESHVAIAQLNAQLTGNDEEQLIGVVVGVPDELTLDLGEEIMSGEPDSPSSGTAPPTPEKPQ